ncbi:MAG: protein translocase subunit SecF [Parcubacteria group bacterium SW_6_46_9]|nr:MAG: protein translocase subunit SecF [Parcubacteria group bacterium SW_6_46_9]
MFIIRNKNIFLSLGIVVMVAAIACMAYFGLSLGIDFTGGSIMEVSFTDRPAIESVEQDLRELGIEDGSVRPTGENAYVIRTPFLEESQRANFLDTLRETVHKSGGDTTPQEAATTTAKAATTTPTTTQATSTATSSEVAAGTSSTTSSNFVGGVSQDRFSAIGPTVGSELATNAVWGIIAVVVGIILFVTFAFRKVSDPVSSWVYGSTAIFALVHDILLPAGVFAVLGAVRGAQVDLLFVMALLAILGFSVNDTIVVFDRIRENLREGYEGSEEDTFADTVGLSLEQTYARSVNTSLTTLVVLAALYFLGGESTRLFSLTLLVGVIAGTYSSIFLASPLLVKVREWQKGTS